MKNACVKYNIKAKVFANIKIAQGYFKLTLNASPIAKVAKPGQFVQILINDSGKPFLRRPFSIHRVRNENFIEILYKVVGFGTQVLSTRKAEEYLDIIGPLGNGFDFKSQVTSHKSQLILIAGGMGVAPLLFLAERLSDHRPLALIGAKTKNEILCEKDFQKLGCDVKISVDDGSAGFKGKVTELLRNILQATPSTPLRTNSHKTRATIYACGPKLMLKAIDKICKRYKLSGWVSTEEYMACGFGVCLGCAIKTKKGYKMVCKDGPVFNTVDIDW